MFTPLLPITIILIIIILIPLTVNPHIRNRAQPCLPTHEPRGIKLCSRPVFAVPPRRPAWSRLTSSPDRHVRRLPKQPNSERSGRPSIRRSSPTRISAGPTPRKRFLLNVSIGLRKEERMFDRVDPRVAEDFA